MAHRRQSCRQSRLGALADHLLFRSESGAQHHNGTPVDAPPSLTPSSRRNATAAAAHNLAQLLPHGSTPLLSKPFDWAAHGSPRREGLRAATPAMAAQFDRDGFVLFEGAFSEEEMAPLAAEVDRLEAELSHEGGISSKDQISFCAHLVLQSELCRRFTGHRLFADLCHDLLNTRDARLYWDQSVYKKPCPGKIFPFHQDNGVSKLLTRPPGCSTGDSSRDRYSYLGCSYVAAAARRSYLSPPCGQLPAGCWCSTLSSSHSHT